MSGPDVIHDKEAFHPTKRALISFPRPDKKYCKQIFRWQNQIQRLTAVDDSRPQLEVREKKMEINFLLSCLVVFLPSLGAAPRVTDYIVLFDSIQRTRQRQRQRNKQRVNDNPVNVDGQPNQEEVALCLLLSLPLSLFLTPS